MTSAEFERGALDEARVSLLAGTSFGAYGGRIGEAKRLRRRARSSRWGA